MRSKAQVIILVNRAGRIVQAAGDPHTAAILHLPLVLLIAEADERSACRLADLVDGFGE